MTNIINQLTLNSLFNITLISGIIFIVAGFIMFKFPPKKINSLYGYRTTNSMKNQEIWDFSQKYASKEMIKLGLLLFLSSLLSLFTNFDDRVNTIIGVFLLLVIAVILLIRVENAIKKYNSKF